jgi:dTMP kinase
VTKRGVFVTFEGGEGAGKTTLIEKMAASLTQEGHRVSCVREPGGTKLGETLRNWLLHSEGGAVSPYTELCLFLASRAQHIAEVIEPLLQKGEIVLCDRFNDSSVAYQGVGRGLGVDQVRAMCDFICHGVQPAITFYLDVDPMIGLWRVRKARHQDRIESEPFSFHNTIRKAYYEIHQKEPDRFLVLDASQSAEAVHAEAMKLWRQRIVDV